MTEYIDRQTAKKCLDDNNARYVGKTQDINVQAYLTGYSIICEFLTTRDSYIPAMDGISALLWKTYRLDPNKRNKFTRSLSELAARYGYQFRTGWDFATDATTKPIQYMLTGPDPQLGYFLRNKLFWKDSMHSYHGEHSHSLQWLAISRGHQHGANGIPIPDLYAEAGNFVLSGSDEPVRLWAWLADSFPMDRVTIADTLKNGDKTCTSSFRSPQNITKYFIESNNGGPIEDNFVSNYLYYRYTKRKWLDFKMHTPTADEIQKGINEPYLVYKYGGDLRTHPTQKDDFDQKWKQSARVENRQIRKDYTPPDKEKLGVEMKFHGRKGLLYNMS